MYGTADISTECFNILYDFTPMIRLRKYVIRRVAKCIEQDLAQLQFFSLYFLHNVFTATKNTTYITSGLKV